MRFTPQEIDLIKSVFRDNEPLLKLMRKVFLPEIDPTAPLGQIIDLWMTIPLKEIKPEDAIINLLARNTVIQHIDQQLIQLNILANQSEVDKDTLKKNSNK